MFFFKHRLARSVIGFWLYNFLLSDTRPPSVSLPRLTEQYPSTDFSPARQFFAISPSFPVLFTVRGFQSSAAYLLFHFDSRR
jgi:hypothetical protein